MSLEKVPKAAWAVAALAFVAGLVAARSPDAASASSSGDDPQLQRLAAIPGIDVANTRLASGTIDSSNVAELEPAWTLPLSAQSTYGAYASTPVIAAGVVYSQDLESNVQAIDLDSGEVLWSKKYEEPDQGPNGVVVAEGLVFGATAEAAFALDQKTGKEIWSTPLVRDSESEGIDMAPGYHDGMVYVSTVPLTATQLYPGGGVGILWALDAKTGKKAWHFNTVPDDLWGDKKVNSGGGLWYAALVRRQGLRSTSEPATRRRSRARARSRGGAAVRAPTSTPTRWSSSTPRPARCSGTTSRRPRHLRLGLPGPAAADRRRRQEPGGRRRQVGHRRRARRRDRQAGLEAAGRQTQRP